MEETLYELLDQYGNCIASRMSQEIAVLLMKSMLAEYYNEAELVFRVRRMEQTEAMPSDEYTNPDKLRDTAQWAINQLKRMNQPANLITDGYHSFGDLYDHRAKLFAAILMAHPNLAWKSKHHAAGDKDPMYDGMFIVGINTPMGQASYHYNIDPYWDLFDFVKEIDPAPAYDGHPPEEDLKRILSLAQEDYYHYRNSME